MLKFIMKVRTFIEFQFMYTRKARDRETQNFTSNSRKKLCSESLTNIIERLLSWNEEEPTGL